MANNGAPDSWEQQADCSVNDSSETSDLSSKISTLNVNAAEFVPSFIPRQTEHLPHKQPLESAERQVPPKNDSHDLEAEEPPGEGAPPPPADSWEEAAEADGDGVDPLLTPDNEPALGEDEEEEEEDEEGLGETISKPKKRPVCKTHEETKSKKEHVNVVFIGHVEHV